jgi:hypothetical protein
MTYGREACKLQKKTIFPNREITKLNLKSRQGLFDQFQLYFDFNFLEYIVCLPELGNQ